MTCTRRPALAHAFRRAALPLGCYYAVTLALPLANGAAQAGGAFVGHALPVLVIPPMLIVLACGARRAAGVLKTRPPNSATAAVHVVNRTADNGL